MVVALASPAPLTQSPSAVKLETNVRPPAEVLESIIVAKFCPALSTDCAEFPVKDTLPGRVKIPASLDQSPPTVMSSVLADPSNVPPLRVISPATEIAVPNVQLAAPSTVRSPKMAGLNDVHVLVPELLNSKLLYCVFLQV